MRIIQSLLWHVFESFLLKKNVAWNSLRSKRFRQTTAETISLQARVKILNWLVWYKVKPLPRTQTSLSRWKCACKRRRDGDNRRDVASPAVCTLPMVPCGLSPVLEVKEILVQFHCWSAYRNERFPPWAKTYFSAMCKGHFVHFSLMKGQLISIKYLVKCSTCPLILNPTFILILLFFFMWGNEEILRRSRRR